MKEYWFAIYPHCFLWMKGKKGLVYNTENYAKIGFRNIGMLKQKAEQLAMMENLYCIRLTEQELADKKLYAWIQDIVNKECGTLVEDNGSNQRPLSLPPVLKVQDEADYYRWEHKQGIDGNVIENLHRMVFHLNGSTYGNDLYAKQFLFPTQSDKALQMEDIVWFATNARVSPFLSNISLVGNPFIVKNLDYLIELLRMIAPVSIYCTQQDTIASPERAKDLSAKIDLHIAITDLTSLEHLPKEATYTFIVTSEQEYESAVQCEHEYDLQNTDIMPAYTGNNLAFFEEFLYMEKEGIEDIKLDKREVFIRQKLNIHDFGCLTMMPDGTVYANPNHQPIGTNTETPHALVYKEMTEGYSWLRVRNETPCRKCIYQWLCPSPSHYEDVIGKPDLCHIKP